MGVLGDAWVSLAALVASAMAGAVASTPGGGAPASGAAAASQRAVTTKRQQKAERGKKTLVQSLAGGAAGMLAVAVLQPLDVSKTIMQADFARAARNPACVRPTNFVQAIAGVAKTDGPRALWRGVGPSMIRVGCGQALYFGMLDAVASGMRRALGQTEGDGQQLGSAGLAAAGATTRILAAIILNPINVIKTRMEFSGVSGKRYKGTIHALGCITRQEGVRGLGSGLLPTFVRDAPYSGIYLMLYERARRIAENVAPDAAQSAPARFLTGATCSGLATFITHPPDVIRTRLQLERSKGGGRSIAAVVRKLITEEGVSALYLGAAPRVLKRALQMGMTWMLVEEALKRLGGEFSFRT